MATTLGALARLEVQEVGVHAEATNVDCLISQDRLVFTVDLAASRRWTPVGQLVAFLCPNDRWFWHYTQLLACNKDVTVDLRRHNTPRSKFSGNIPAQEGRRRLKPRG